MACHNLTLILMTGSLLSGLVLAIGHHFFYDYLNNRIVESQNQQEWFLRIGTGMAFLVRALLSAAVGIAYTQILWRTLRSKSITIEGINSLFGVSHTAWDFTTLELWTAAPGLAIVAMIAWALPLIAVITPATLSIEISSETNVTVVDSFIPSIDYGRSLWFGSFVEGGLTISSHVIRTLLPVATLGTILPIAAPFPNSSYTLEFYGPTISCDSPEDDSFRESIKKIIHNDTVGDYVTYVSFVPFSEDMFSPDSQAETWYDYAIEGLMYALNDTLVYTTPPLDFTGNITDRDWGPQPATFYVLVPDRPNGHANRTIECQLHNATYSLNITFDNGLQDIKYKTKRLNGVSVYDTRTCFPEPTSHCNQTNAYLTLMSAMGDMLFGTRRWTRKTDRTRIGHTVLIDLTDMNYAFLDNEEPKSLIGNLSMPDALEEMFENVTISLLGNSEFLQNDIAISRGPVTRFSTQNAFSYEPRNLFIAYGIGILCSLIVVIFGLLCIKAADASYTNSFSTILRTTRNPELDAVVPSAETSGAEPLSKHLSSVRLVLRHNGEKSEGGDDKTTFFAVDTKTENVKKSREERPTESLLKPDSSHQNSDSDEISTTQEGSEGILNQKKDGNTLVTSND